jgi:hypothetical protein
MAVHPEWTFVISPNLALALEKEEGTETLEIMVNSITSANLILFGG